MAGSQHYSTTAILPAADRMIGCWRIEREMSLGAMPDEMPLTCIPARAARCDAVAECPAKKEMEKTAWLYTRAVVSAFVDTIRNVIDFYAESSQVVQVLKHRRPTRLARLGGLGHRRAFRPMLRVDVSSSLIR